MVKKPTIGTNRYAIVYGNSQLIGWLQRSEGKHKIVVRERNGVRGSTKSAHFFGYEVSDQVHCICSQIAPIVKETSLNCHNPHCRSHHHDNKRLTYLTRIFRSNIFQESYNSVVINTRRLNVVEGCLN